MTRFRRYGAAALAGLLLGIGAGAARGEFYDLDGRYQCLAKPGAVCYDATPSRPDPAPPPPAPAAQHEARPEAASTTAPPPAGEPAKHEAKPKPAPPPDPFEALVARVQARKPTPGDLATLRARAKSGDARALEILAWCEFTGLGVERDPVRAYFLYGQAAAAGAPRGRQNQAAIYERALTPDQRQQVLDIENGFLQH